MASNGNSQNGSMKRSRTAQIQDLLLMSKIDMHELKNLCFSGVPENQRLRPICWRLLLNYLPLRQSDWPEYLTKQRAQYAQFILDLVVAPEAERAVSSKHAPVQDHPLCVNADSNWSTFFKDNENLAQIDKDVRRLLPEISFFQQPTDYPCVSVCHSEAAKPLHSRVQRTFLQSQDLCTDKSGASNLVQSSRKLACDEYVPLSDGREAHWELVERILFLYYKLNPGVKYVQGMNEIVGPIYYVFATDPDPEWAAYAEADTFYCLQNLLTEIKDFFIKTLDSSSVGIESSMRGLFDLLESHDVALHTHITVSLQLVPEYFAFRWISLLLSQEFLLPDVIQIWDSLFSDEHRFSLLLYVCLAMIILVRDRLLDADFSTAMKLLQNYDPDLDVAQIVSLAAQLRQADKTHTQ